MKIGLIGCGNMGTSIAKQLALTHPLFIYDQHPERITFHHKFSNVKLCHDVKEVASHAEIILLVVKPGDLDHVAEELKPHLQAHHILVSVLMGVSIARLKEAFGPTASIVRMMPNLAVEYGKGVSGFSEGSHPQTKIKERVSSAFETMGLNLWIPESKMDGITALSGSGPAFVLIFLEAMIDAGITLGFNSEEAKKIAMQTMAGALAMLEHSGKHPGELRWQVSSPGGSTIAGTFAMEEAGIRAGVIKTFLATYKRAKG